MPEFITEKNFPLQNSWFGKNILGCIFYLIFIVGLCWLPLYIAHLKYIAPLEANGQQLMTQQYIMQKLVLIMAVVISVSMPISLIVRRKMFYFSLGEKYITLKQGIISKSERHMSYGVIQNLFIKQDLFDRIFGLASLSIEDASQGAGAKGSTPAQVWGWRELVGFVDNKVGIPGISKQDAEKLKEIILQKMRENPVEDSQSGL